MISKFSYRHLLILPLMMVLVAKPTGFSQRLAQHDLYLFSLFKNSEQRYELSNARFMSNFNPKGYTNQPCFFGKNEIYLTAQFAHDTTQTEIVALDLAKKQFTKITRTAEAEYSPKLMPNGERFSTVRVEADKTQRLWTFPLDRLEVGYPLFPKIKGVGYYAWLSDTLAAMFIVGENEQPHQLVLVGTRLQKAIQIASNIGRCLRRLPDGQLAFVQKATATTWFIKTYHPQKKIYSVVNVTPTGSEDFAVLSDGTYLMGQQSKLFALPSGASTWLLIEDLSKYGLKKITRLEIGDEGQLLIVDEKN